jgi:hypothetical protein
MCAGKMHADEADIDASLVGRLLTALDVPEEEMCSSSA